MVLLKRTTSVLRRCRPEQRYWHGARVVVENGVPILETEWRNPELAGIWVARYTIAKHCFRTLAREGIFVEEGPGVFVLGEKGEKRMRR